MPAVSPAAAWNVPGRDTRVRPVLCPRRRHRRSAMNRYAAPLGFTLAAVWVVILFVLVSSTP